MVQFANVIPTQYADYLKSQLGELEFRSGGGFTSLTNPPQLLQWIVDDFKSINMRELRKMPEVVGLLFSSYLRDVWVSEFPPSGNIHSTIEIVDNLLVDAEQVVVASLTACKFVDPQRVYVKLANVRDAMFDLFGRQLDRELAISALSLDLVRDVHRKLGARDLFPETERGLFREKPAGARGSSVSYCMANQIKRRLEILLAFVQVESHRILAQDDPVVRTGEIFKLATIFFRQFLLIHPFSNGNGRTARLLTNVVLNQVTIVPFSLFYRDRKTYLDVLEAANNGPPHALAFYLLHGARKTMEDICWLAMDLQDDSTVDLATDELARTSCRS